MFRKIAIMACLGLMPLIVSSCIEEEADESDACKKLVRCSPDAGRYYFSSSSPNYIDTDTCEDDFYDIRIYNIGNKGYDQFISCIADSCSELKQFNEYFLECKTASCQEKAFLGYAPCMEEYETLSFDLY